MKQISTLIAAMLCLLSVGWAQQSQKTLCGYDHLIDKMSENDPNFKEAYQNHFEEFKKIGEESIQRNSVVTIPVVVHIVWHTNRPEENLPDSVIEDQIRVMNESFRFTNPDKVNLRDTFINIVDDARIEFELAGVVRKETTNNFGFGQTDLAKRENSGGSNAWDTKQYMNIWVFKLPGLLGGQLLGMAYPPPFLPNWPFPLNFGAPSAAVDGLVVDFRVFGSNNPNSLGSYDARGRTTVHEIGHYLGLRHIWGDGNCAEDDGAKDTPRANQQSTAYDNVCDPERNICHNEPIRDGQPDRPEMWENYMDYATESCQVAFTKDQITIMRGALEGPRAGLLNPLPTAIDLAQRKELGIYPNPVHNGIAIFTANEVPQSIQIFDILGKQVNEILQVQNGQELNFKDYQDGVYIVTATFKDGKASTRVIVK